MKENRQYKRIHFSTQTPVLCRFRPEGGIKPPVYAKVLDLSEGGLGLAVQRSEAPILYQGDRMRIEGVEGLSALRFFIGSSVEIRWIVDERQLLHMLFGCEFVQVSGDFREKIKEFIVSYSA